VGQGQNGGLLASPEAKEGQESQVPLFHLKGRIDERKMWDQSIPGNISNENGMF
jgi:hypothetical protein